MCVTCVFTAKSYPAIRGGVFGKDLAFARFCTGDRALCQIGQFAIKNNELSPDAQPPLQLQRSIRLDVHTDCVAYLHDPNPAWINQEVGDVFG